MDEIIQKIIDKIINTDDNNNYTLNVSVATQTTTTTTTTLLTVVIKRLPEYVFWYKFLPQFSLVDQETILKIKESTT